MKLTYFRGAPPNFGDELNATMWRQLLPTDFFDDDETELFLGIGSIIQDIYPKTSRKIVVGAGYGGYSAKPDVLDGTWDIRFVRGPKTAEILGLDPKLAITDAAVMLRATDLPAPAKNIGVAFIPHYESVQRGAWKEVCDLAGIYFIDPTRDTDKIMSEIQGADLVICEAMHGAIVSDALRTPWIGVSAVDRLHRSKWFDWASSLKIDYRPQRLFPSSLRETWTLTTGRSGDGPGSRRVLSSGVMSPFNYLNRHIAAQRLMTLAKGEPQLSRDDVIESATDQALAAVNGLVQER